jgi:hypothetical protein
VSYANKDPKAGKKRLKDRQRNTLKQKAKKDSKAGSERIKGRQRKTQRQARNDSQAGKK